MHWAHGGPTSLDNLVLLCRLHHWLTHEGGFQILGNASDGLRFLRPDGQPIPQILGPTPLESGSGGPPRWLHLDADSLTPPWWAGDPLRLAYVVSIIMHERERRAGKHEQPVAA